MEFRTRDVVNLETILHNAYNSLHTDESTEVTYDVLLIRNSENPTNPGYKRVRDRHFVEGMLVF